MQVYSVIGRESRSGDFARSTAVWYQIALSIHFKFSREKVQVLVARVFSSFSKVTDLVCLMPCVIRERQTHIIV